MSNHFSMGAINKITNKYEYPRIANKINKYKCPSCEKDVIFKILKLFFTRMKKQRSRFCYSTRLEIQLKNKYRVIDFSNFFESVSSD